MTKMITKNVSTFTKSPKLIAFNWNDRDDGSDVVSAVDGGAVVGYSGGVHVVHGVDVDGWAPGCFLDGHFFDGHFFDGHFFDGHFFDGHFFDRTFFRRTFFRWTLFRRTFFRQTFFRQDIF